MSRENEDFYPSNHPKLGVAMIFNQFKFESDLEGSKIRHGSKKDSADLSKKLGDLGFEVRCFEDRTVDNIKSELYSGKIN